MLIFTLSHIIAFICSIITAEVLVKALLSIIHKHTSRSDASIGGLLFLPAMAVGLAMAVVVRLFNDSIEETLKTSSFIIAVVLLLIYLFCVIDALLDISRWRRYIILIITSIAFPLIGLYINDLHGLFGIHHISWTAGFIITFIVTILIIRSLEALNTIDGLASIISLIVLLTFGGVFFAMGRHIYATLSFAMAGAVLVFLKYNLWGDEKLGNKIHMGYAGLLTIGYCIVYLALKYAMDNSLVMSRHADAILLPYSLLVLPVFEYIRSLFTGRIQERNTILLGEVVIIAVNLLLHHVVNLNITWIVLIDLLLYIAYCLIAKQRSAQTTILNAPTPDFHDFVGQEGLVSIVMPTYNSAAYVAESIESILAQTYKHWELIITDDCSTDETMTILQRYAEQDPRIIIQRNEVNGGAGVSRNRSISTAHGQYIAFCDSDDRWLPNKLQLQLAFMQEKDVALCFAPYYTCDINSQFLGYVSAPARVSLFSMMCDNKIGFLTAIYDTRVLGKHLMPRQRKRQDHALLLTLLKRCNYAYSIQQPLAFYRVRPDNLSAKKFNLLKYNAQTYTEVFGWNKVLSYIFLFTIFLPSYFAKRLKNIAINILRAA